MKEEGDVAMLSSSSLKKGVRGSNLIHSFTFNILLYSQGNGKEGDSLQAQLLPARRGRVMLSQMQDAAGQAAHACYVIR